MKYRVLVGLLVLVGFGMWVSCGGSGTTTNTDPGVVGTSPVFVVTQGDNLISPFILDRAQGKLTANGKGVATGSLPSAVIQNPAGDTVFVLNTGSNDISRYTVKTDGTLTAVTPNTPVGGTNPIAMTMDAAGKLLFVLNEGAFGAIDAGSVSVFNIGSNAGLTAVGTSGQLNSASAIAVTPDAKFLYVTDSQYSMIQGFSVDGNGGLTLITPPSTLTPNGGQPGGIPIAHGTTPMGLLTTPDDAKTPSANPIFLYVANAGTGQISAYEICDKPSLTCSNANKAPGDLLELSNSPFAAGGEPGSMVMVNPTVTTGSSGTFLYAADKKLNRLWQFSVSPVTGALTALSPPAVSTGTTPVWVGARHDGQYVITANNGSQSISVYVIHDPQSGILGNAPVAATGTNPSAVLVQ